MVVIYFNMVDYKLETPGPGIIFQKRVGKMEKYLIA